MKRSAEQNRRDIQLVANHLLANPEIATRVLVEKTGVSDKRCLAVRNSLIDQGHINSLSDIKKDKYEALLSSNKDMTYNQAASILGKSGGSGIRYYKQLIAEGKITPRGYAHFTVERKTRVVTTDELRESVTTVFLENPTLNVVAIAKKAGVSYSACLNIHDNLAKAGKIITRRTCRTKVASEPPLYIHKANFLKVMLDNPTISISAAAKLTHVNTMLCYRFHDELVSEGKMESRRSRSKSQRDIYGIIDVLESEEYEDYTIAQLAKEFSIGSNTMYKVYNALIKAGLIDKR